MEMYSFVVYYVIIAQNIRAWEKSNVGKVVNRGCGVPDGFSVVPPYMNQRAVMFGQVGWGWC